MGESQLKFLCKGQGKLASNASWLQQKVWGYFWEVPVIVSLSKHFNHW
jgi:hypothetical protein